MMENSSARIVIEIDKKTGKILDVTAEGKEKMKLEPKEMDAIYQSDTGFKYVGTLLYTHNSPGCVYVVFGGWPYKICWGE